MRNTKFAARSYQVLLTHADNRVIRDVASLTVPGGQEFHFPHFFLKFWSIFLTFPQTFLIFFLILALRVGESPTREGPGYDTARDGSKSIIGALFLSASLFVAHFIVAWNYFLNQFYIFTSHRRRFLNCLDSQIIWKPFPDSISSSKFPDPDAILS